MRGRSSEITAQEVIVPMFDTLLSRYLRWFNGRHMCLQPLDAEMPVAEPGEEYLLYIHIPFCESLCPYCSFHRFRFERDRVMDYYRALRHELSWYHQAGYVFTQVYVGGGTPTVLPGQLISLLQFTAELFPISRISIETNPNHLRPSIIERLRETGVNRLSVGVQSLEDGLLQEMQRFQAYGGAGDILRRLQQTQGRFETFNVDMMFNFPHQTITSVQRDIVRLKELGVDQISYYPLMPATPTRHRISSRIGVLDFRREREFYQVIHEALMPEYHPTTAWCFSRRDSLAMLDEYITEPREYVGIGSGAFSYLQGRVYASSFSLKQFYARVAQGDPGITAGRRLTLRERAQYDFLMRLFGGSLPKAEMEAKYGTGFRRLIRRELALFTWLGAVRETAEAYCLTPDGLYYWVIMMREFFIAVNDVRARMRRLALKQEQSRTLW